MKLPASASYVVVGGLGGLGRSACQWLVEHGAKNIILLSRNAKSQANASFLEKLRNLGAKIVADNCDVADKLDLARAMDQCKEMPPVRGVIQGAMVLQVGDLWLNIYSKFDINEYIRTQFSKKCHLGISAQHSVPNWRDRGIYICNFPKAHLTF